MTTHLHEILTYDIFKKEDNYVISIPVSNLVSPKFLLKDQDLYIFLYNYTQGYIIKDLPDFALKSIEDQQCFLVESLKSSNNIYKINLFP